MPQTIGSLRIAPGGQGFMKALRAAAVAVLVYAVVQATLPAADTGADEKAIRATADDFVRAFNAGDAKAIGALWATDAEYTDESASRCKAARRSKGIRRPVPRAPRRDHDGHDRIDPLPGA